MLTRTSLTVIGVLTFVLLLPAGAQGAMTAPDPAVSSDWRGGTLSQAENRGNSGNAGNSGQGPSGQTAATTSIPQGIALGLQNLLNSVQMGGSFESGTVDFKGTVTDRNSAAGTLAVNGIWMNPERWIGLAADANFRISGADPNTLRTVLTNLGVGDRIQVRAEIANGDIRIVQWDVKKPNPDQAQLQARLQDLIRQLNDLLARLRSQ